jgi:hypothetical protein
MVMNEAAVAVFNLLPEKSKLVYEKGYKTFCTWKTIKNSDNEIGKNIV